MLRWSFAPSDSLRVLLARFVPVAMQILKEMARESLDEEAAAEDALNHAALQTAQELVNNMTDEQLQQTLQSVFLAADTDGNGTLDVSEFRDCLRDTDLGLTDDVIKYLVQSVDTNEDGLISYSEFAPLCYELLTEVIAKDLKAEVTSEMQAFTMAKAQNLLVHGMSKEDVEELIQAVFTEVDTDNNGRLDPEEFVNALSLSKLNLSDDEAASLLTSMHTDPDGMVSLDEFRPIAFQILTEILAEELSMGD